MVAFTGGCSCCSETGAMRDSLELNGVDTPRFCPAAVALQLKLNREMKVSLFERHLQTKTVALITFFDEACKVV